MPLATTQYGDLKPIKNCYIHVPIRGDLVQLVLGSIDFFNSNTTAIFPIEFNIMPDIGDDKGANYSGESSIGRATPMETYASSEARTISVDIHLAIIKAGDNMKNLRYLRVLQSALYPRRNTGTGSTYEPPPICRMRCGELLGSKDLCVVLRKCNVKFNRDVPLDEETLLPYYFTISTNWDVVYRGSNLPHQERIVILGA